MRHLKPSSTTGFRLAGWWTLPALLVLGSLGYGLVVPWLGFYWDDWPFLWIRIQLGAEGLSRYFTMSRPAFGWLTQLTIPLVGTNPTAWQLFGLFTRALCAASLWWMLRLLWPSRLQAATWTALLFVVYPGFDQQPIAINYSTYFIILTFFFLSLALNLAVLRNPRLSAILIPLAMAASLVNLATTEYFFVLEAIRPILLWVASRQVETRRRQALVRAGRSWLPLLTLFLAAVIYRMFFFQVQTYRYQFTLMDELKSRPLLAGMKFLAILLGDMGKAGLLAFARVFQLPAMATLGRQTFLLFLAVVMASFIGAFLFLLLLRGDDVHETGRPGWAVPAMALGLLGLFLAGWPFWLTQLPIGLDYPNNRFTLPFMPGASLLVAGLLRLIPGREWKRATVLALILALSAGFHFQSASSYRRDWNLQKNLFWQLAWRAPAIQPHTAILANDLPSRYSSDNSLTAPLNWTYAANFHGKDMPYVLYYTAIRMDHLSGLRPGHPIVQNYHAAVFHGSTTDVLALYYQPPGCVHILDPEVDPNNSTIPALLRQAAAISDPARLVLPVLDGESAHPVEEIFGREPAHGWCYYYERAELARQQEDWGEVVNIAGKAYGSGDYPNDPVERFPFIEGYAHTGNWGDAVAQSGEAAAVTPLIQPALCRLWDRIGRQVAETPQASAAIKQALQGLDCGLQ